MMNYEFDLFKELNLRKRTPINLVHNLFGRELGTYSCTLYITNTFSNHSNRHEKTKFNQMKRVYLSIYPNYSILNVRMPNCFLRRFSPDGRYIIAFNQHLNGIQVFSFNGSSAGLEQLQKLNSKFAQDKTDLNDFDSDQFRQKSFDIFFKETANLRLTENNELIHRECALFYKNSFLIVASSVFVNEENLPSYDQIATNNEAIHYNTMENYTIYLVDINRAVLCDKITFTADKINLTHNQSLSLYKNMLAILSQQNQTIHIYYLMPTLATERNTCYKFVLAKQIGRFCFSDDLDYIQRPIGSQYSFKMRASPYSESLRINRRQKFASIPSTKGYCESSFTGLKQRIISFFYKEALHTNTLSQFYLNFNDILKLRMYKMQLLDDRYLLIKYGNIDHMVTQKSSIVITNRVSNLNPTSNPQTSATSIAQNSASNPTSSASASSETQTTTTVTNIPVILNESAVPFFFVLYDTKTATVLNILKNTSSEMLKIYENLQDYFSLSALDGYSTQQEHEPYGSTFNFHTLPSNNLYANQQLMRHIKMILKTNTTNEMTKSLLSQLPISSQSFTTTPYLDHSLFSYDEKLISNLERPKPIGDQVIKFNVRETGRSCFRLYPGLQNNQANPQSHLSFKRLVAFIWHPREPFCVSVQRATTEYNVNFHVYSKNNLI
ncbi:DET1 -like protein [Brachionus plicatilis]|uniref:DET1-like protein n=1 Tax=Brachionus plicatilis TaxID=10195 RepID=A0A3M7Q1L1_BRAPC|nr:DET1 -like protein [Brachionus plicatilis]